MTAATRRDLMKGACGFAGGSMLAGMALPADLDRHSPCEEFPASIWIVSAGGGGRGGAKNVAATDETQRVLERHGFVVVGRHHEVRSYTKVLSVRRFRSVAEADAIEREILAGPTGPGTMAYDLRPTAIWVDLGHGGATT